MQAFEGIRVIDLTRVLAGPFASYQFALLGADVIKVEPVGKGESTRWRSEGDAELASAGLSPSFITQGANKRAMTLNLDDPRGQALFLRLVKSADVVVENLRTGSMARRGIGYEDAARINPAIIYCSITGYGQTGPKARYPAYDSVIQAASGLMSVTGTEQSGPLKCGPPVVDYATGHAGAFAIAAALFQRSRTGQGQHIDLSMLDTTLTLMSSFLTTYQHNHKTPGRRGNEAPSRSPASTTFQTREGLLAIAINEQHQFVHLMQTVGLSSELSDPRFADAASRRQHTEVLRGMLEKAMLARSAIEWEQLLNEAGVPASRVLDVAEVVQDRQVAAREFFTTFTPAQTGVSRPVTVPGAAFRLGQNGPRPHSAPPRVGQHTEEILLELGLSQADIDSLRLKHVI